MTKTIRCGWLTATEKSELWDRWKRGESLSDIGRAMGRYPTDVFKQLSPSGGIRPRSRCRLVRHRRLRQTVARKLCLNWSPEQIAGWLKRTYPNDEAYHVSHETIYRSLYVQARGVLKKELMQHLRSNGRYAGLVTQPARVRVVARLPIW